MATSTRLLCGLDLAHVLDISSSLSAASEAGYSFICCPIVHPRYKREFVSGKAKDRPGYFTRSDMVLTCNDWNRLVLGKLSPYLDLDSVVEDIRVNSEEALLQELSYASHLGLAAVLVQLKSKNCINLARHIHNRLLAASHNQALYNMWIQVPMRAPQDSTKNWVTEMAGDFSDSDDPPNDPWEWWNTFRTVCNYDGRVSVALELTPDLPSEESIKRWLGEPVRIVLAPTHIFLTNKKGFPVLSRSHQLVVRRFFKMNVQLVVTGANRHEHIKLYHQYIDYLWQSQAPEDLLSVFGKGYEDYLQCPLQPLMDNLESNTYEIFEKDPVKYTEYKKAMYEALLDKIDDDDKSKQIILMVMGAGRGPLVRAALASADRAKCNVKVYAVEKNPNAVVTLLAQQDEMWGDRVTVVSCDMREWEPPQKADILVSELLGSFGDNELSPECLDGAQKFLKDNGISIPSSYTSFLAPLQSMKLFNEVRLAKEKDKIPVASFETPYVVHLHNILQLAAPQPLFTFSHPNTDAVIDNRRYDTLTFRIRNDSVLHGFAGYFETTLYKDTRLSIVPETHSDGMFSWFPILFPIKDPVPLKKGCQVEVHFWRCVSKKNVWYEWLVTKPQIGAIHNPNGRSYTIGL